jgi:hypothetical protein
LPPNLTDVLRRGNAAALEIPAYVARVDEAKVQRSSMALATAYLDTNFFSILHYSGGQLSSLAQHERTKEWWRIERPYFDLYTSRATEIELRRGVFLDQRDAIASARRLTYLPITAAVRRCANLILEAGIVPENEDADAGQLALATIHRIDYLITWNYTHIANVHVQLQLEKLTLKHRWRTPLLVSPTSAPWASMGHTVRRKP